MNNNFMGKDGFVWWIGVVENRNDPLKLGALRVRIAGWHTESLVDMPSEMLPWTPVMKSCSGSNFSIDVKEGDWVVGFFMDGNAGQKPVVFGAFDGIKTVDDNTTQGFSPQLTDEQKKQLPSAPENVIVGGEKLNEPTTSRMSRGKIEGTLIEQTNKEVVHVCDIATQLKQSVIWERLKHTQLVTSIRDAIQGLITALGNSPDSLSQKVVAFVQWLRLKLKWLQNKLKMVTDYLQITVEVATQLRAIADWILSLPARLQAALSNCLTAFLSGIGSLLSDVLTLPSASGPDISSALNEVKSAVEQAGATITTASEAIAVPAQIASAVLAPSSISSTSEIQSAVDSYITQQTETNQSALNSVKTNIGTSA